MLTAAEPVLSPAAHAREVREPIPATIPRKGREQAPMIRDRDDPTRLVKYRRASGMADRLEDAFALDRRNDRLVMACMVRDQNLADEVAAVLYPGGEEPTDWDKHLDADTTKDALWGLRDAAIERMGGNRRAALGTEFHGYVERALHGEDMAFLGPQMHAAVMAAVRLVAGWTVHATELFVVCDRFGSGGTLDALMSPPCPLQPPYGPPVTPDDRIVVDWKTGAKVTKLTIVVQQTQYPNGVPYVHLSDEDVAMLRASEHPTDHTRPNGRQSWPDGVAPRTDWALIPHIPLDSPQDAGWWWVDLTKGAVLSELVVRVHEVRKWGRELVLPAELPARPALLAQMRADALTAAGVEDGPEFVEPPVDAKATLLAARAAMFDKLAAERLMAEIRTARLPMTLLRLLEAQGGMWPSEAHKAAATARWFELQAPVQV